MGLKLSNVDQIKKVLTAFKIYLTDKKARPIDKLKKKIIKLRRDVKKHEQIRKT